MGEVLVFENVEFGQKLIFTDQIPENCQMSQTVCLLKNQMAISGDGQVWTLAAALL